MKIEKTEKKYCLLHHISDYNFQRMENNWVVTVRKIDIIVKISAQVFHPTEISSFFDSTASYLDFLLGFETPDNRDSPAVH